MKNTITTAIISAALFTGVTFTKPAQADDFLILATSLCEYTKANDRNEIRKVLKKSRLKIRRIYNDIQCNGKSLYDFAQANEATDVMAYFEKKVKKV